MIDDINDVTRIVEEHLDEKIKEQEMALKKLNEKRKRILLVSAVVVAALNDSGHNELAEVVKEMIENG